MPSVASHFELHADGITRGRSERRLPLKRADVSRLMQHLRGRCIEFHEMWLLWNACCI